MPFQDIIDAVAANQDIIKRQNPEAELSQVLADPGGTVTQRQAPQTGGAPELRSPASEPDRPLGAVLGDKVATGLDFLRQQATGATSRELIQAANDRNADVPPAPEGLAGDKALHAIASREATDRMGPTLGNLLGYGQEALGGIGNIFKGGNFFEKDKGFDFADIAANQVGIQEALRNRR